MSREELEALAAELDLWLWTHRREANPVGYADRERELARVVERLEEMR